MSLLVESTVRVRSSAGVITNAVFADFPFKTPYVIRSLIAEWPRLLHADISAIEILRPRFAALSYIAPTARIIDWVSQSTGANLSAPNSSHMVLPEIAFELWTVQQPSEKGEEKPGRPIDSHMDIQKCADWLATIECSKFYPHADHATHLAASKAAYIDMFSRWPANYSEIFKMTYTTEDRLMVRTRFVQW